MALFADFLAHGAQLADAAHVALAPSGDAAMHPLVFADDLAVELMPLDFFFFQHLVAPVLERRKALLETARLPAVEPNRRSR